MTTVRASSWTWLLAPCVLLAAGAADAASLPGNLPLRREAEAAVDGIGWLPALLLLALLAAAGYVAWRRGALAMQGWSKLAARPVRPAVVRMGGQALTPQASVHLVRFGGEELLIGCTSTQVSVLARRTVDAGEGLLP